METALQFLERMYLPGYMVISNIDFNENKAYFDFDPVEPPITILSSKYLTPRGTHICISQAGYCFWETLLKGFNININNFRKSTEEGMLKLVEFNQRFRRELNLDNQLQGKLVLTKSRSGKIPIVKMDFNLGNRAITGSLTGVIAPNPVPQTNADILRQ